jgi:hypothetical protein
MRYFRRFSYSAYSMIFKMEIFCTGTLNRNSLDKLRDYGLKNENLSDHA